MKRLHAMTPPLITTLLAATFLGLWSCGKSTSPASSSALATPIPELPVLSVDLRTSATELGLARARVLEELNQGTRPSHSDLLEAFGEHLMGSSKLPPEQANLAWNDLKKRLMLAKKQRDPHELKQQIESLVSSDRPIRYERDQRDPLRIGELVLLQCDSGTQLYELGRLNAGLDREYFPVVIAQEGHVLPGYIQRHDSTWELYGVEMTVSGRGKVPFGPIDQLSSQRHGAMRILFAEYFLVLVSFQSKMKDPVEYANRALNATAQAFSIPTGAIEPPKTSAMGSSGFYFGQSKTPSGVQARAQRDELKPNPTQSGLTTPSHGTEPSFRFETPFETQHGDLDDLVTVSLDVLSSSSGGLIQARPTNLRVAVSLGQVLERSCRKRNKTFFSAHAEISPSSHAIQWWQENPATRMVLVSRYDSIFTLEGMRVVDAPSLDPSSGWRRVDALLLCGNAQSQD